MLQAAMERYTSFMVVVAVTLISNFASSGLCLKQDIFAPSYVYPCSGTTGCAWDVFKTGATLAIINPSSGPGTTCNSDYVTLVNTTVKSGTSTVKIVLGYVSTSYGARNSTLVQADINKYYSCYKVDGIFLDEGATACDSATITKYQSYNSLVKSKGGLGYTVLNWGTNGPECYLTGTTIDSYVTFEAYFSNYTSSGAPLPYMFSYPSTKFWVILHTAPANAATVNSAVALSKNRNVGHIYITDDIMPNPYDTAPQTTVWSAEKTAASSNSATDIYAPSYVYPCSGTPGCAWDVFKNGSTLAIINPNSGPGTTCNSDYVTLVNTTVKSGTSTVKIVLGYVSTSYGNRNSTLVQADINKYYSCYKVDGIFLDEGATACDSATLTKYQSYNSLVKSKGGLGYTVLNWGTNGPECYLTGTTIDSYVTFEDYFSNYTSNGAPLTYMTSYTATKFWVILHSAPSNATAVNSAVALSKTRNVGHIYITDDVMPNPYDSAPQTTVWQAEKSAAALP
ncbi:hypothetical protein KC19_10G139500 [Ceratodon purpureus]|uniref:Uncharacterized protein n=2 Tax=Ceratodon purpureus TaxID=3225 RepID=A0A8T0GSJ1_CERPU|nr:hypothetical protein KC19_10G139500 [Ceratodon purpureus]